jgi:1-acyl-sn-glycerol-3-phosphate acyltransferase
MHSYGAIPIRDASGDVGAVKAALAELAAGRTVLVYPEGSRSADGSMGEFKRGVGLLMRRAAVTVVPMAVEGASDVWPPSRRWPALRGRLAVKVGEPIPYAELMVDGSDAALARLRREVERLRRDLHRELRARSGGRWPAR